MGNLLLASAHTWSDAATIVTSTNEMTGFEATKLQIMQPTDFWQSQDLSSIAIEFDIGSVQPFNLIAWLYHNLRPGTGTIRTRTADTQGNLTASPTLDTGALGAVAAGGDTTWTRRHFVYWASGGVSNRWVRFDLADPGHPYGMLRAGRVVIANAWQSSRNFTPGRRTGWQDASPRVRTLGQETVPRVLPPSRVEEIEIPLLSATEVYTQAFELQRLRGSSKDILFIPDPDESTLLHQQLIYGLMDVIPIVQTFWNRYAVRIRIEELL